MALKRIPVEETFAWQRPVINMSEVTAPAVPAKGDRYVIAGIGGAWSEFAIGDIVWYDGAAWQNDVPQDGWVIYNQDDATKYTHIIVSDEGTWTAEGDGTGDMLKSTYDTNDDGVVNAADKAGTYDADLGCITMDF